MIAKTGLRERPTYEGLMQTLRNDFPLKLPNRDAYFLRNSLQMMQFDGIGMLDNLEEQSNRIAENQLRATVLKDVASGKGVDAKLIQTDPSTTNMVDRYTQAISKKSNGGSQTNIIETRGTGSSTDRRTTKDGSSDPMVNTRSSGSSTDRRTTTDSGNDPMVDTREASSQVAPLHYDIAGDPVPMDQYEEQVVQRLEESKSLNQKKKEKAAAKVKTDLEKTRSTTGTIVNRAEKSREKRERKMDADKPNEDMPASGAASSSRGVSPPRRQGEKRDQTTPEPSPGKKKKGKKGSEELGDDPESRHEPKGKPGRPKKTEERPQQPSSSSSSRPAANEPETEQPKRENPKHATDVDNDTRKSYWGKRGVPYIIDQLSKRNVYISKDDLINAWRDSTGRIVKVSEKVAKQQGLIKKKRVQGDELKEMVYDLINKGKWVKS
jgi:hypothetical protein